MAKADGVIKYILSNTTIYTVTFLQKGNFISKSNFLENLEI